MCLGGMTDQIDIEERLSHLIRTVEDLSDVVARQERDIDALTRRMRMLGERLAEAEAEADSGVTIGNERPPHY